MWVCADKALLTEVGHRPSACRLYRPSIHQVIWLPGVVWWGAVMVPEVKKQAELGERGFAENSHMAGKEVGPRPRHGAVCPPSPRPCPSSEGHRKGTLRKDPWPVAGVESSLRVTCCRQILQNLPEHNYAVLSYLMGFLHEVRGPSWCPGRPDLGSHLPRPWSPL